MSTKTRAALLAVGLDAPHHRSRQATATILSSADLIIAAAPEHVAWVRREHPIHAERTATLIQLVRSSSSSPTPLVDQVTNLGLADQSPGLDEEIVDPGGGEVELYIRVAGQIVALMDELAERL